MVTRESAINAIDTNEKFAALSSDIMTKRQGTISFYMLDEVTLVCKYQYTDTTDLVVSRKKIITLTEKEYTDEAFYNAVTYQIITFIHCEQDKYCSLIPTNSYVRNRELDDETLKELDDQFMKELGRHVVIQKGSADYTPPESTDPFTKETSRDIEIGDVDEEEAREELSTIFDEDIIKDCPELDTTNKLVRVLIERIKDFKASHPKHHINMTGIVAMKIDVLFDYLNEAYVTESYEDRKTRKRLEREENREMKAMIKESVPFDPTCNEEECVLDALAVKETAGELEEFKSYTGSVNPNDLEVEG